MARLAGPRVSAPRRLLRWRRRRVAEAISNSKPVLAVSQDEAVAAVLVLEAVADLAADLADAVVRAAVALVVAADLAADLAVDKAVPAAGPTLPV
jgi:sugar-specific transcriptional regulator TrmB